MLTVVHEVRSWGGAAERPNDTRAYADSHAGLYAIVDGTGPTYGGVHRPVGLEPGWAAMLDTWRTVDGNPPLRLERAMARANAAMFGVAIHGGELVHTAASMTVAGVSGTTVAVAQVGNTQGWLVRDGKVFELAPRHTLASENLGSAALPDELRRMPSRCMGLGPAWPGEIKTWEVRRDDAMVLCTEGAWASFGEADVAMAGTGASLAMERVMAASSARAPGTLLVLRVRDA